VLGLLALTALIGLVRLFSGSAGAAAIVLRPTPSAAPANAFSTELPEEIRGVHITGPLMSLPGKFRHRSAVSWTRSIP